MNQTNNKNNSTTNNPSLYGQLVKSHLPEETIKQKIGDLGEWAEEGVEPILTPDAQQKIDAYDEWEKLGVKDLPKDWKNQLVRLKHLEGVLTNYEEIKTELDGWKNTFTNQKPQELQEKITELEQNFTNKETELKTWTDIFGDQTAWEVEENRSELVEKYQETNRNLEEWQTIFSWQSPQEVQQKIIDLEKNLSEWTQFFGNRELKEVEEEWEFLKKRPALAITEKKFFDDYARREPLTISKKRSEELLTEKNKSIQYQGENKELWRVIGNFLNSEQRKAYALSKPVSTFDQAQQAIAELLEKTEQNWQDYLNNSDEYLADSKLDLTLWKEENKQKAKEILTWIGEAKKTSDYQTLFEKWNGGKEYNKKYDFDGVSLYLLGKYLEVK